MRDVDAHVQQLLERVQAQLDEILQPRSAETLAQVAELQAAGVSARRINSLYPVELSDYERGYDRLEAGEFSRKLLAELKPVQTFVELHLIFTVEALRRYNSAYSNFSYMVQAVAIVRMLSSEPFADVLATPLETGTALLRLTQFSSYLEEVRYCQLLDQEGDPLRRLTMRLRRIPALLGLDGTRVEAS